jgi:hypothetical protein
VEHYDDSEPSNLSCHRRCFLSVSPCPGPLASLADDWTALWWLMQNINQAYNSPTSRRQSASGGHGQTDTQRSATRRPACSTARRSYHSCPPTTLHEAKKGVAAPAVQGTNTVPLPLEITIRPFFKSLFYRRFLQGLFTTESGFEMHMPPIHAQIVAAKTRPPHCFGVAPLADLKSDGASPDVIPLDS